MKIDYTGYYPTIWNPEKFNQKLQEKKPLWEKELKPLVRELLEFEEVIKIISLTYRVV